MKSKIIKFPAVKKRAITENGAPGEVLSFPRRVVLRQRILSSPDLFEVSR